MTITRHTKLEDLPAVLRVAECAVWLDCGTGTIYELIRRGDLKANRVGRLVRVARAELERYATRPTVPGPGPTIDLSPWMDPSRW